MLGKPEKRAKENKAGFNNMCVHAYSSEGKVKKHVLKNILHVYKVRKKTNCALQNCFQIFFR